MFLDKPWLFQIQQTPPSGSEMVTLLLQKGADPRSLNSLGVPLARFVAGLSGNDGAILRRSEIHDFIILDDDMVWYMDVYGMI